MKTKKILALLIVLVVTFNNTTLIYANDLDTKINNIISNYKNKDVSVYYKDLNTGVEYKYNENVVYENASIKKIPIYLYVYTLIKEGKMSLDDTLVYKASHTYGGTGIIQGHPVGSVYTVEDLLTKSIVYSDNIAFIMLQKAVNSSEYINFIDSMGGRVSYYKYTVDNVANYMQYLYDFVNEYPQYKEQILSDYINTIFNDKIPAGVPKDIDVAHKIGVLGSSYHDASIVYDEHPYILIIMSENGSSYKISEMFQSITKEVHDVHTKLYANLENEFLVNNNLLLKEDVKNLEDVKYINFLKFLEYADVNFQELFDTYTFDLGPMNVEVNFNEQFANNSLFGYSFYIENEIVYIEEDAIIDLFKFKKEKEESLENFKLINNINYTKKLY